MCSNPIRESGRQIKVNTAYKIVEDKLASGAIRFYESLATDEDMMVISRADFSVIALLNGDNWQVQIVNRTRYVPGSTYRPFSTTVPYTMAALDMVLAKLKKARHELYDL